MGHSKFKSVYLSQKEKPGIEDTLVHTLFVYQTTQYWLWPIKFTANSQTKQNIK